MPEPEPVAAPVRARVRVDAAVAPAVPAGPRIAARGDACGGRSGAVCGDALACIRDLPGGSCVSPCGLDGLACGDGGACVPTPRDHDVCAKACRSDGECRTDEGYLCDPVWHACLVPGFAAIAPRRCAAPLAGGRPALDAAFGAPEAVDLDGALYARAPAAAVLGDGSLATLAISGDGEREQLVFTHAGTVTWLAPGAEAAQPALVRAGDALYAAWRSGGEHPSAQLAVSRDRGETWDAPRELSATGDCAADDTACPERPRLAVSPHALYASYSSDAIGTRVRSSRDGGATWSAAATALTGARGDLAAGADGRLHVIAMTGGTGGAYGSAQHTLEYTYSADGGRTFARAVTISARDEILPTYFGNPTLALDARRGWIYVAYARGGGDAAWAIELAASKDKGKTWTRTRVADDGCAWASVPSLAVDGATGTVHVTWYDTRDPAHGRYAHATCAPGGIRCTERGAIAALFASLSTGRRDATWLGDSESLVIDERRRTLHAVWTQPVPVAGGLAFAARVFHAAATLKP